MARGPWPVVRNVVGATSLAVLLATSGAQAVEPVVLDGFEDATTWQAAPADGMALTLHADQGRAGAALRLDLDFQGHGGYAAVHRALPLALWGTQTNLWHYYTAERPPLWIIPAWPIASLSIDRITRGLDFLTTKVTTEHKGKGFFKVLYWLTFSTFLGLMLVFVAPSFDRSVTWLALGLCILLVVTPTDHRFALLTFFAGAGLGYSLELWGTTRECWTYYTYQTPPLFAVLAHGMAAVAFWRTDALLEQVWLKLITTERIENTEKG